MAYNETVSLYQTATNAAASLAPVEFGMEPEGTSILGKFRELRDAIFEDLKAVAGAVPATTPERTYNKSESKSSGGSGKEPTLEEALALVPNFGKFKPNKDAGFDGLTLGEIYDISAEEASDSYGYETGPGKKWIQWLAKDTEPKRQFASKHAKVIIEARQAASDADN